MSDGSDAVDPSGTEMFRRIMSANGPIVVSGPGHFRRAVGALATKYDGRLTDAEIRKYADFDGVGYVWFRSDEADVLWGPTHIENVAAPEVEQMPYETSTRPMSELMSEVVDWPSARRL